MNSAPWMDELNGLLMRFSGMGIEADVGALNLCELWGLYCFLRRMAEE